MWLKEQLEGPEARTKRFRDYWFDMVLPYT